MKIDLNQFRQTFFQEATDHVNNMEALLLTLDENPDPDALNAIFRAAHSIKGGSGTFGFDDITRFTHRLEELLDRMRQGKVDAGTERVQTLLRACDVLRALLTAAHNSSPAPVEAEELAIKLTVAQREGDFGQDADHKLRASDKGSPYPTLTTYKILFTPSPDIFREGMDPLLILRELHCLGEVTDLVADVSGIPSPDALNTETCYLSWRLNLATDHHPSEINDVFAFVEDGAKISIEPEVDSSKKSTGAPAVAKVAGVQTPKGRTSDSASIRVATEKVDSLINLVGELVIAQSMAMEIVNRFTPERLPELQAAFCEVSRNTRELQQRIMSVRMLPVGTIFARLPRIVHDVAASTGKSIRIEMSGEDTELDKTVLEGVMDPLTHLVRNAADHGLETTEERFAAGKTEQGVVCLAARHEGGNFIIEVSDDGKGLNAARIRQKAIERGLITGDEELSTEQIQALIFQPGFSTAEKVSDISGRGVGMDVVRRNVEKLGGVVSLRSNEGRGTTVVIRLPLTLAILEGQLVQVGEQTYVLPLVSIVESIQPRQEHVRTVAGKGEVVVVRGEALPLLRLHRIFAVRTEVCEPHRGLVAVVEHDGKRLALLVDELLSQQQVVIKNLQSNFRKVDGAMGATILGDGRVSLILDVAGLVDLSRRKASSDLDVATSIPFPVSTGSMASGQTTHIQ